jgi:hypothetical protein
MNSAMRLWTTERRIPERVARLPLDLRGRAAMRWHGEFSGDGECHVT